MKKQAILPNLNKKRKAIAMVELVFAIVIMGLVLLSAPMLIDRSSKSTYVALQQESIAAAATQINMIMTAEWDDADTNSTEGSPVLQTETTSSAISNCTTLQPVGVTSSSGRYCTGLSSASTFFSASTTLGTEGSEGTFYDDIDDYNNKSYKLSIYQGETYTTAQGDYLDQNITITSQVYYGDDTPRLEGGGASAGGYDQDIDFSNPFRNIITANTTNIKLITVTLTSSNPSGEINDKQIILSSFMCNIGAPKRELYNNESTL